MTVKTERESSLLRRVCWVTVKEVKGLKSVDSVFSSCLKLLLLIAGSQGLSCREFQTVGPAAEKAGRPKVLSR